MTGMISDKQCGSVLLLKEIRSMHEQYPLCCNNGSGKKLLSLEDPLLSYPIAIMRGVQVPSPESSPAQWEHLLSSLRCHWIMPFMYWRIMACPGNLRPPESVLNALKAAYLNSSISYLKGDKQLAGLADVFDQQKIEFLVLKGAALSRTVYPDQFIRPGSDIDILVRPGDVRRSRKALEIAGYRCNYPYFEISGKYFCEEEFTYIDSSTGYLPLELHWDQSSLHVLKEYSDLEGYFSRSIRVKVGKREISVMDPADALIYQSVHMMAKHYDNVRLSWINDIAILCRHLETTGGWGEFRSKAMESNTGPLLRPAMRMAELWAGIKVPEDIFGTGSAAEKSVEEAFEKLTRGKPSFVSNLKTLWPAEAPILEKCRLVRYFALPPRQIMRTIHFPGQDISLPAMHLKRWRNLVGRNLRL